MDENPYRAPQGKPQDKSTAPPKQSRTSGITILLFFLLGFLLLLAAVGWFLTPLPR